MVFSWQLSWVEGSKMASFTFLEPAQILEAGTQTQHFSGWSIKGFLLIFNLPHN